MINFDWPDPTKINSYSISQELSILIQNDGILYGRGNNEDGTNSCSFHKRKIEDGEQRRCDVKSVCSGQYFSLYLYEDPG